MPEGRRRVTSADVAREAGLSRGTVSYALNGDPDRRLTESTRRRVLEAAERLGYAPSSAARLLRGGRSRTVLLLSPDAAGVGAIGGGIVEALARALGAAGYSLVWQLGVPGAPDPVRDLSPAIVLTAPTTDDPEFARLAAGFSMPVLSAFEGRDEFIAEAAAVQVRHLAGRGCSRIVYAAPSAAALAPMAALREHAAAAAARDAGIPAPRVCAWPAERAVAAALLAGLRGAEPLAVAAYNDELALAVLAAAADAGLQVPTDVAVIGADDTSVAASAVPALTTVRGETAGFPEALARAVVDRAEGRDVPIPRLPLHFEVIERATVGRH